MMNKNPSLHPARAAIAAVLAFGSTPLIAQTAEQAAPPPVTMTQPAAVTPPAAPAEVAPPVAAAPAAAAPAPVMAPPSPVVQPIPQPTAAPAPAPEEAAPVARAEPAKRVQKAAPVNAAPVAAKAEPRSVEAAPPVAVTPVVEPATPAPVTSSVAAPDIEPTPAATPVAPVGNDNMLLWGTVGGVLLLSGAGLALLFRRRRPTEAEVVYATEAPIVADPVAPVAATPLAVPVLNRATERPVETATVTAPLVAERAPAGSLEEMVARAPSKENPFLTRRNRLRRAAFLMEQSHPAATEAPRAAATITTAVPAKPSREVVYDFGSNGKSTRRGLFPATT